MYKILMFGTGNLSIIIKSLLNDNVSILAYVDNNKSKWNSKLEGIVVIAPDQIINYDFDYMIIGSQFNEEINNQLLLMNIDKNKIFQYSKFMDNYWNHYKLYIDAFIGEKDDFYEVLVTGISYALFGFRVDTCIKKAFKFAFGSQDLFYDYHTAKYLIDNYKNKVRSINHVIIGLSYYSFQYDMSLSAMKGKTVLYYEVLKNSHHFHDINTVYNEYDINKKIASNILKKNKEGNYDFSTITPELNVLTYGEEHGKNQAEVDCNKNYPTTVRENIEIFKSYLRILIDNNIKPIVVVFPASKYYTDNFSKRIEGEFKKIIEETKQIYKFQYIDYFRSDLFEDCDFQDVSHLNWNGAKKFTKILNQIVEW